MRCAPDDSFAQVAAGALSEDDRFSFHFPAFQPQVPLGDRIAAYREARQAFQEAEEQGRGEARVQPVLEALGAVAAALGSGTSTPANGRPAARQRCAFLLAPQVVDAPGNRRMPSIVALLAQREPRRDEPEYKWGIAVPAGEDPCAGETPEDCAARKIARLIDKLCDATKENPSPPPERVPRFPDVCTKLRAIKAAGKFETPCTIDEKNGNYNNFTEVLSLDGEYLLTSDCAIATLLHEGSHGADDDAGREPATNRAEEISDRLEKILAAVKAAEAAGDRDEAHRLLEGADPLSDELDRLWPTAAREKLVGECKAYRTTHEGADALFDPGSDEGKRCLKNDYLLMIQQLRGSFDKLRGDLTAEARAEFCRCLKDAVGRIEADQKLLANLEKRGKYKKLTDLRDEVCS